MSNKYRKKPVVIEAIQLTDSNRDDLVCWCGGVPVSDGSIIIFTLEGDHRAYIGDYIIKGVKGEFYPCKQDIFKMTYEQVNEEQQ